MSVEKMKLILWWRMLLMLSLVDWGTGCLDMLSLVGKAHIATFSLVRFFIILIYIVCAKFHLGSGLLMQSEFCGPHMNTKCLKISDINCKNILVFSQLLHWVWLICTAVESVHEFPVVIRMRYLTYRIREYNCWINKL